MTNTITPEQRLTIVKHLAGGKDLDTTSSLTRLDRSTVLDIASHHGYPDTGKLTRAVTLLEQKIERDHAPTLHPNPAAVAASSARESRSTPAAPMPPAAGPSTPPAAGSTPLTRPDEIRVLINTAKGHPAKRIQAQADRVIDAVDRLRDLIREDQAKHAERRRAEAEKAAARAEVDRLETQLRAAKAKLKSQQQRPGGVAAARSGQLAVARAGALVTSEQLEDLGVTSKGVRNWAHDNDVECPNTGRLPSRVLDAYKAAHPMRDAS